jgi:hypothetical protein
MPNQNNFRSDITTKTEPRFLASRIVKYPEDGVLLEELPGSFGYDNEDNVEFHFYSTIVNSNDLILSVVTKLSDGIVKLHIVGYTDGTYKNYLQIDFTKLFEINNLVLIPGTYKLVMNFFSDEIGSYADRRLSMVEMGPSRTEVELIFNNEYNSEVAVVENSLLLREFLQKSFNRADAVGVLEKIFKSGVQFSDDTEGATANNVIGAISVVPEQTYDETIGKLERVSINQDFSNKLNEFIPKLFEMAREEIIIKGLGGDERIQQDEMFSIIERIVKSNIHQLQQTIDRRIVVT